MASDGLTISVSGGASAFSADEWDKLAGASRDRAGHNPFITHAFLKALEDSGSVGGRSGWTPQFITARHPDGCLAGVIPSYVKSHSQGEYVFDHGWADALERAGGRYYPKLQISVPFTPATGPRLLAVEHDAELTRQSLVKAIEALVVQNGLSSAHVTFANAADIALLHAAGWLMRRDVQFHFFNRGYRDFGDVLDSFASRKRKQIRKEREAALGAGITITRHTGKDITEDVLDAFFACYIATGSRKWGSPYLTRSFFSHVAQSMGEDVLFVMASRGGRMMAGAINFIGANALYGRNWGCVEDHPFLHFEVCYYQAIDFALERGLARVEAGAQGQHKLARGYEPVETHSAHFIAHPGLRDAVARYLAAERADVATYGEALGEHTPFRKGIRQD